LKCRIIREGSGVALFCVFRIYIFNIYIYPSSLRNQTIKQLINLLDRSYYLGMSHYYFYYFYQVVAAVAHTAETNAVVTSRPSVATVAEVAVETATATTVANLDT
jgi:hypothetical protein